MHPLFLMLTVQASHFQSTVIVPPSDVQLIFWGESIFLLTTNKEFIFYFLGWIKILTYYIWIKKKFTICYLSIFLFSFVWTVNILFVNFYYFLLPSPSYTTDKFYLLLYFEWCIFSLQKFSISTSTIVTVTMHIR